MPVRFLWSDEEAEYLPGFFKRNFPVLRLSGWMMYIIVNLNGMMLKKYCTVIEIEV